MRIDILVLFIIFAFMALGLPVASSGGQISLADGIRVDHTMAKDIGKDPPFDPLDKTDAFMSMDKAAVSWLRFERISGYHRIEWQWYSPDGNLCYNQSSEIPDPNKGKGEYWENHTLASAMDIKGSPAEKLPGNWIVDIYKDGEKMLSEPFRLSGPAGGQVKPEESAPNIQFIVEAVDPIKKCVYYTRDSSGHQVYKIWIYTISPDAYRIRSVKYVLHETFEDPDYTSTDASKNFEMILWTWGRFSMPIIVTTTDGVEHQFMYPFTFRDKLMEAQSKGYRLVDSTNSWDVIGGY